MESWFEESFRELRRELRRLMREVEKMVEPAIDAETGEVEPLYEVIDAGDKLVVRVDMPKVNKNSIEVLRAGSKLVIRAGMREPVRLCDIPFYSRCEVTGYRLELDIPPDVDVERIQAAYRSGYLEVILPKQRVYRIKVE